MLNQEIAGIGREAEGVFFGNTKFLVNLVLHMSLTI